MFFLARDVEIENINAIKFGHQEVLRLDVAVCHIGSVQVLDALKDLLEELFGHILRVVSVLLLSNRVQHLLAFDELHYLVDLPSDIIIEQLN